MANDQNSTDADDLTLSADKTIEPAPEGLHPAICIDVFRLGKEEEAFENQKPRTVEKLAIVWQIFPKDGSRDSQDAPFLADVKVTASVNDGARLRLMLESWKGRSFTSEELKAIQPGKNKGEQCLLEIFHTVRLGNIYANVMDMIGDDDPRQRKFSKVLPYVGPALKAEPEHYDRQVIVRKYERMRDAKANKVSAMASTESVSGGSSNASAKEDYIPF